MNPLLPEYPRTPTGRPKKPSQWNKAERRAMSEYVLAYMDRMAENERRSFRGPQILQPTLQADQITANSPCQARQAPTPQPQPQRRHPYSLHPAEAYLLAREVALQDALAEAQQDIGDAAQAGRPCSALGRWARLLQPKAMLLLHGFRIPRRPKPRRPRPAYPLSARLHRWWIGVLESIGLSQPLGPCSYPWITLDDDTGGQGNKAAAPEAQP